MDLGIRPKLTKDYVLKRVSQIDIIERFLAHTGTKVQFEDNIPSPVRSNDLDPSARFYDINGKIKLKDYGGDHFWGDCFDIVGHVINENANDRIGFNIILETIAKEFRIHKYESAEEANNFVSNLAQLRHGKPKVIRKTYIDVRTRDWNGHDEVYWNLIAERKIRDYLWIFPIKEAWVHKEGLDEWRLYKYHIKDPCYGYYFGTDSTGRHLWRLYFPYRNKAKYPNNPNNDKGKFFTNNVEVQGKLKITAAQIGIITKSYKDVACLLSYGFRSVALPAEGIMMKRADVDYLTHFWDHTVTLFDYDRTGIRMAIKMRNAYGLSPFFLKGKNKFPLEGLEPDVKDISDYTNKYGRKQTKEMLLETYYNYKDLIQL